MTRRHREVYLDFIRFFAILFVIFNHTHREGFFHFVAETDAVAYGCWLFASLACKVAVPLFFMVSGAVLLNRNETIRLILTKRVMRFAVVLVVATFFQYFYYILIGRGIDVHQAFYQILSGKGAITTRLHIPAFWYLYAYLAMLLSLPFLRSLAQNLSNKHYLYLIILCIFMQGCFPFFVVFLHQGRFVTPEILNYISFFEPWVLYPLLGYFLAVRVDVSYWTPKRLLWGFTASVVAIALTMLITWWHLRVEPSMLEGDVQVFHNHLVLVPTCFLFVVCRRIFASVPSCSSWGRLITWLGGLSFSVMLLENIGRGIMRNTILSSFHFSDVMHCLLCVLGAYLISASCGAVLKQLPGVRKWL